MPNNIENVATSLLSIACWSCNTKFESLHSLELHNKACITHSPSVFQWIQQSISQSTAISTNDANNDNKLIYKEQFTSILLEYFYNADNISKIIENSLCAPTTKTKKTKPTISARKRISSIVKSKLLDSNLINNNNNSNCNSNINSKKRSSSNSKLSFSNNNNTFYFMCQNRDILKQAFDDELNVDLSNLNIILFQHLTIINKYCQNNNNSFNCSQFKLKKIILSTDSSNNYNSNNNDDNTVIYIHEFIADYYHLHSNIDNDCININNQLFSTLPNYLLTLNDINIFTQFLYQSIDTTTTNTSTFTTCSNNNNNNIVGFNTTLNGSNLIAQYLLALYYRISFLQGITWKHFDQNIQFAKLKLQLSYLLSTIVEDNDLLI